MAILDRQHLAVIRAVARHGSMTAAANALHLSQSALSHTIRKLEQQLGTAIWHREGRNLRPTRAGALLLNLADRLLPQLERAEDRLQQMARGERGSLHIGMECHPCYVWLQGIVSPYLDAWPHVDVDVKQRFQFGGIAALLADEIDLLVTPDPLHKPGLLFEPVFEYEQVLVVSRNHPLARFDHVEPEHLADQVLISYPVEISRLDIFSRFLLPAGIRPKHHKRIEATDILLQMVACNRGVTALPHWLVDTYAKQLGIQSVRLGAEGLHKRIYLGAREADIVIDYLRAFIDLAREQDTPGPGRHP